MKKTFLRVSILVAFGWVLYANMHLVGSAADTISRTNREMDIKGEMRNVATCVKMEYVDTNFLPEYPAELYRKCLAADGRSVTANTGKDKWGSWFRLVASQKKGGFYVVSLGPDRRWNTKDDIRYFQSLADVGFGRPAASPNAR